MFFSVCFKIFDSDRDGLLDEKDLQEMIATMLVVRAENKSQEEMVCASY